MWWGTVADRPHFFFPSKDDNFFLSIRPHFFFPSKDDNFFFFLWSCFMKSVKRWINKIEWATLQRYYIQYDNNTNTIWVLFEAFSPILKFVLGRNSSFFSQNKYIFYWPRTKLVLKKKDSKDAGSSKYGTTRKNTQRYHTPKRLTAFFFLLSLCSFLIKREK